MLVATFCEGRVTTPAFSGARLFVGGGSEISLFPNGLGFLCQNSDFFFTGATFSSEGAMWRDLSPRVP